MGNYTVFLLSFNLKEAPAKWTHTHTTHTRTHTHTHTTHPHPHPHTHRHTHRHTHTRTYTHTHTHTRTHTHKHTTHTTHTHTHTHTHTNTHTHKILTFLLKMLLFKNGDNTTRSDCKSHEYILYIVYLHKIKTRITRFVIPVVRLLWY